MRAGDGLLVVLEEEEETLEAGREHVRIKNILEGFVIWFFQLLL